MHLYEEQFSEDRDYPRVDKPTKFLIIASTGRCGSHMLGHALHQTRRFGFPLEYANPSNLAEWKRRLGIDDFAGVIAEIQKRRTSPNGLFGIKIHYSHIKQFGGFDQLDSYFPNAHYILLSRKDVLRQAVSLSIASQTGVWMSGQKAVNDNPVYDGKHIDHCLRQTILENASWRYVLAGSGRNYMEIDFDSVRKQLSQSIEKIARFVNVAVDPADIPTQQVTKRQSVDINAEWAEKFCAEFNGSDELMRNLGPNVIDKIKGVFR